MSEKHKQEESHSIIESHRHEQKMLDNVSEDIQRYLDMQVIDPDWEFAAKHAKSCRPGLVNPAVYQKEKCICCMREVNKDPIPLCSNTKSLQFLGYGFPLYFIFLKYLMVLIFLLIVTYTGIELSWAVQQNHDFYFNNQTLFRQNHNITCSSYMVYLSRLSPTVDNNQRVIRLLSFITLVIALLYMRDKIRKTNEYYDERSTNYSDFSLLVQNLPNKSDIENDPTLAGKTIGQIVRGFLSDSRIFQEKVEPIKTIFIGEFSRMEQLYNERKQKAEQLGNIQQKYKNFKEKQFKAKQTGQTLNEQQIQNILKLKGIRRNLFKALDENSQIAKLEKFKLLSQMKDGNIDGDKIILCYKQQNERQYIEEAINNCPNNLLVHHFGQKGNNLKVVQAPQPQQIIWENINQSSAEQYKRLIFSWLAFILILCALSISFYFLLKLKSHEIEVEIDLLKKDPHQAHFLYSTVQAIVYCSLIFIILFNKLIFAYIIHHLVEYQRHITGQAQQFALCLKYTLGLFFTTALMTLLVQGATYHNVYETDYGILEEQTIMFYLSSFAVPAIWLINPWYILQWIKRKYYHGSKFLTQDQANKLMEDPEYLMGKRYGELLQIVWFTYLYSCVIPFGSILILIGIVFYYWVDKYNLLRKSSVTEGLAVKLKLKALNLLDFVVVLKPAGEMIFDRLIRHDWEVVSVIQLCFGIIYMILPINKILDYMLQQDFRGTNQNYFDLQKNNFFNYQLYNPLTKEQQLRKHFNQIEQCTDSDHDHPSALGENYLTVSNKLITCKKCKLFDYSAKKRIYSHKIGYKNTIVRPHNMNESRKLVTMPDGSIERLQD